MPKQAESFVDSVKEAAELALVLEANGCARHRVPEVVLQLRFVARKTTHIAERYCNGDLEEEQVERAMKPLRERLNKSLASVRVKRIEYSLDPRGAPVRLFFEGGEHNSFIGAEGGYAVMFG